MRVTGIPPKLASCFWAGPECVKLKLEVHLMTQPSLATAIEEISQRSALKYQACLIPVQLCIAPPIMSVSPVFQPPQAFVSIVLLPAGASLLSVDHVCSTFAFPTRLRCPRTAIYFVSIP